MQSALRRIGNSTGLVLPRSILGQIGLESGAVLELEVDAGRIIATPVDRRTRAGWADVAARLVDDSGDAGWQGFANADDAHLAW